MTIAAGRIEQADIGGAPAVTSQHQYEENHQQQ